MVLSAICAIHILFSTYLDEGSRCKFPNEMSFSLRGRGVNDEIGLVNVALPLAGGDVTSQRLAINEENTK